MDLDAARRALPAVATEVTDLEGRRQVFTAPSASCYRETTGSVDRLVEGAPLVRVTFTGDAAALNPPQ